MAKVSKARHAECRARLLELLQPGDTIFATVTHVSRSGMSRTIDFHVFRGDARNPMRWWLTPFIGDLLAHSWNDDGVRVTGCGMDMAFHLVYNVGATLWPDGYPCTGDGCRSNDHSNGDRDYSPHQHKDGGYALHSQR